MLRSTLALRAWAASVGCALCAALAACGARSELRVPDDAPADDADAFVRYAQCVEGRFAVQPREARVVFVIDRSGSMRERFADADPRSRWGVMRDALEQTLPRFEERVEMGALVFPKVQSATAFNEACAMPSDTVLDVEPARGNAASLLGHVEAYHPDGATPTAAAIATAARRILARPARGVALYLLLATDGAPNCNAALDASTCACTEPGLCAAPRGGPENCLDDQGAVAAVERARRDGVSTYVVGIDGDLDARYVQTLDRMAVAGGRPLAGPRRYYSVREREQLAAAFEDIERTVARCAFVTPSRPDEPDRIVVRVGGVAVPRDPSRQDGWDWTDRDYGELTLFGAACDRAMASPGAVEAAVSCGW